MSGAILVGVDGSTGSEDALRWALREARLRGRAIIALLAWGGDGLQREVHRRALRADHTDLATAASTALDQAVDRAGLAEAEVSRLVVDASPVAALEENSADVEMIVVGSHGHGPVHRALAGSVAQGVVNHARVPVVVVRGATEGPPAPRPVIVGVDGSGNSVGALRWAAEAAALRRAPLRVVHALGHTDVPYPELIIAGQSDLLHRAQETLDEIVAKGLAGAGEIVVDTVVTPEAPSAVLLRETENAQLLVVGHRGRGGFAELLLGSVSHQSILHARCPVAVVPGEARTTGTG
ncbi:universal stress protein [Parafrankia discariae]|uniref:universal stress protein n=1 Tax=Parafrankia discariae TaxID=365528 RepID=UPI0003815072|nr:universal stress protein [Parafrankia discariae]